MPCAETKPESRFHASAPLTQVRKFDLRSNLSANSRASRVRSGRRLLLEQTLNTMHRRGSEARSRLLGGSVSCGGISRGPLTPARQKSRSLLEHAVQDDEVNQHAAVERGADPRETVPLELASQG